MFKPLALFIGLRYTRAKKKNHFVSFISLSSMLGARMNYIVKTSEVLMKIEFDGAWQREYLNHNRAISYTPLNASGVPDSTTAIGMGRNSWLFGIDFLATIQEKVQLEASCDFKWNSLFVDSFFYLGVGGEF